MLSRMFRIWFGRGLTILSGISVPLAMKWQSSRSDQISRIWLMHRGSQVNALRCITTPNPSGVPY